MALVALKWPAKLRSLDITAFQLGQPRGQTVVTPDANNSLVVDDSVYDLDKLYMVGFTRLPNYGSTASRPIVNLSIGDAYFDQTLGYQVVVKQVSPAVWVSGSGAIV